MKYILGIDSGTNSSAYILLLIKNNKMINIIDKNWLENNIMLKAIIRKHIEFNTNIIRLETAIETIVPYGNKMGQSTIDTAIWAGRFLQLVRDIKGYPKFIQRPEIKLNLCHTKRAKDTNVTQALKDRFGELGTKKNQGRLYEIKNNLIKGGLKHVWSALAIAISYYDINYGEVI